MKKKWLSVLALAMCFSMGVSMFAGCKDKDGDKGGNSGSQSSEQSGGGNESDGGNQEEQPLTKDEIYAEVMKAFETTMQYQGVLTVDAMIKSANVRPQGSSGTIMSGKVSLNPTDKLIYTQMSMEQSENELSMKMETIEKAFKEGDSYYRYEKQSSIDTEEPMAMEAYYRVTDAYLDDMFSETNLSGMLGDVEMLPTGVQSIDALNAAFAEVFADSKAQVEAGTADEESEWYQHVADGSYVILCEEAGDVLSVTMSMDMEVAEGDDVRTLLRELKLVTEGGYITEYSMKSIEGRTWYEASEDPEVTEPVEQHRLSEREMSYKFAYTFDQAGYDAIATTLPAEVEDMKEEKVEGYHRYVNIVINGIDMNGPSFDGDDVQSAVASFFQGGEGYYYGMNVTWYTDEACTKPLTVEIMEAELNALETIYGKATAEEGFALVIEKNPSEYAADVTDAYKLVMSILDDGYEYSYIRAAEVEDTLNFYEEKGVVIKVNGEVVEFEESDEGCKTITMEEGKTYIVEHIRIVEKASLNIFNMIISE